MRDYRHPVESGARLRQRLKAAVTDDYIRKVFCLSRNGKNKALE